MQLSKLLTLSACSGWSHFRHRALLPGVLPRVDVPAAGLRQALGYQHQRVRRRAPSLASCKIDSECYLTIIGMKSMSRFLMPHVNKMMGYC